MGTLRQSYALHGGVGTLLLVTLLTAGMFNSDACALNVLEDAYTNGQLRANLSSSNNLFDSSSNGANPTGFNLTVTSNFALESEGTAHGTGFADYGKLGATLNLSGPGAREASSVATFHDVFTIATPFGVTPGTPGELTYSYLVDGFSSVTSAPGETPISSFASSVAGVRMTMYKWTPDGNGSAAAELIDRHTVELIGPEDLDGTAVILTNNPGLFMNFTVPFNYGEPLALTNILAVNATADNRFLGQQSNPFFLGWGGGVIENVYNNYLNTAELVAIVNEAHPDVAITGVSSTDYSSLVTDTLPSSVPIPAAAWLFGSGLVVLVSISRRRNT